MIDRRLKKQLRETILALPDAALTYIREESSREINRRRVQSRERRKRARISLNESAAVLEDGTSL